MPKLRYKVKEICGDYYYEEMSVQETIEKALLHPKKDKMITNHAEIDMYMRDNLLPKLPLDGPQWRLYGQNWD